MSELHEVEAFNCIAWILNNRFVNENDSLLEFKDHAFLIDPYLDNSPKQAIMKAAQIGWSTLAILRSFHLARFAGANIIHTFPSRTMSKDFVVPKVNPLLQKNKALRDLVGVDTVNLKQVADRYIYYRGSFEQTEAISISANILINDEYDRCFPANSVEVLTKDGWKLIEKVTTDDYLLTRHPVNHLSSFKKPSAIIAREYDGDLYRLLGRGIDIPATSNHRFLVQFNSKKQELLPIKEIFDKPFSVLNKVRWTKDYRQKVVIPRIDTRRNKRFGRGIGQLVFPAKKVDARAWFQFLGWYLSEGCVAKVRVKYGRRATGQIIVTQKDKENVKLIVNCIRKLGFSPKLYQYGDRATQISFSDLHLALYLQKLGDAYHKFIPKRWLWAHPKLCEEMLKTLMLGDGDERGVYTTVSKKLADCVQILILRTGNSANIYMSEGIYKVGIIKTPYRRFNGKMGSNTKATVRKEHYRGMIYCVDVPNHTILVRGKGGGLPIWSGNSNQRVLKTYRSRLDDTKRERPELSWEWQFSNPSIPGYGVDVWWQKSDQKHWFIKCRKCGKEQYLRFPDNVCLERELKVCSACHEPLSREDLQKGRWVNKYDKRKISGYWISQMMIPWIPADKIIDDSHGDQDVFHNFTLGLPYVSKDTSVSREAIIKCLSPGYNPRTNVAIGVDNGVTKHYVIGNKYGIFEVGETEDWEEIERLRNRFNAIMVIDALPYPNTPRKLADKYPGKVFVHYYQTDRKSTATITWQGEVVKSDRTKIIDSVVADINARDITFNMTERQLEDYIHHWRQIYRVINLTPQGIKKPSWETGEGRADHYAHSTVYWRIALEQTLGLGTIATPKGPKRKGEEHPEINPDNTVKALDLEEVAKNLGKQKSKSWKTI